MRSPISAPGCGRERMERLWKNEGATGRKRFERLEPGSRLSKPNLFATGCRGLPPKSHDKEGVDGSSPSEGSAKAPEIGAFSFRQTCSVSNVRCVWSRLWSFCVENAAVVGRNGALASL